MTQAIPYFDAAATKKLISFKALSQAIATAATELAQGQLVCPDRQVLTIPQSKEGVLLSMPSTAQDICAQKLISLLPHNSEQGLPTIQGLVTAVDSKTGKPLAIFDGPTITGMRTAALSMLGIQLFTAKAPTTIVLIGCGTQAQAHIEAIHELYPQAQVYVATRDMTKAQQFCLSNKALAMALQPCSVDNLPAEFDVLITLTTATSAVYKAAAKPERLLIGVGAFRSHMVEINAQAVLQSLCVVDEPVGALHEAGDLIQADKNWDEVISLAQVLEKGFDRRLPIFFKTVGCSAWDLAAVRCALSNIA